MENINLLERLDQQLARVLDELTALRVENARLAEELLDCRADADARATELANQQEAMNLQAIEIEDMLERIGSVLDQEAEARNDGQMDIVESIAEHQQQPEHQY